MKETQTQNQQKTATNHSNNNANAGKLKGEHQIANIKFKINKIETVELCLTLLWLIIQRILKIS